MVLKMLVGVDWEGNLTNAGNKEELDCVSDGGGDCGGFEDAEAICTDLDLMGCGVDDGEIGRSRNDSVDEMHDW